MDTTLKSFKILGGCYKLSTANNFRWTLLPLHKRMVFKHDIGKLEIMSVD